MNGVGKWGIVGGICLLMVGPPSPPVLHAWVQQMLVWKYLKKNYISAKHLQTFFLEQLNSFTSTPSCE